MESTKIQVGFFDKIITPTEPVPLGGYGNTSGRMHQNVLEDIHAIAVALTDAEGNTVLFVTMDTTRAYFDVVADGKKAISEATGLPADRIMITCTHTHSGPDMTNTAEPSIQRYEPVLVGYLKEAALGALEDRKPALIYTGNIEATGLNFVKHYCHTEADGTVKFFGDNFGRQVMDETTRHTTDADPTLHLIRFQREGGKDVVLANWRAHPQLTGGYRIPNLSADFPAPFRSILEAQKDCKVLFLQGAAGNINPKSRIPGEEYSLNHNVFGARLAYFAAKCLDENMVQVPAGLIRTKQVIFAGKINHLMDHLLDKAKEIAHYWVTTADREGSYKMGLPYGIHSPYHAQSVIAKAGLGESLELELNAIAIGDHVAFVTAPNELFDTNSVYTEENSPFDMTFTCGYANGHWFYIPSQFGYDYNCYESHVSRFAPGTGEEVSQQFLTMLGELKGN